jgi:hypothetical protein
MTKTLIIARAILLLLLSPFLLLAYAYFAWRLWLKERNATEDQKREVREIAAIFSKNRVSKPTLR